jgi:hypothetical protein
MTVSDLLEQPCNKSDSINKAVTTVNKLTTCPYLLTTWIYSLFSLLNRSLKWTVNNKLKYNKSQNIKRVLFYEFYFLRVLFNLGALCWCHVTFCICLASRPDTFSLQRWPHEVTEKAKLLFWFHYFSSFCT